VSKPPYEPSGLRHPRAHADSPAGSGGTGFFAPLGGSRTHPGTLGRGILFAGPVASAGAPAAAAPAKPPPTTPVGKYDIWRLRIPSDQPQITIEVTLTVLSDTTGEIQGDHAETNLEWETTFTGPDLDWEGKKVTKIKAPLEVTVAATMQTRYPEGLRPTAPSEYGRGTTTTDIANGDTSLGFHEWWHHEAVHAFTRSQLLRDRIRLNGVLVNADFPSLVGMKPDDVKKFGASLKTQLDAYFNEAKRATGAPVDEVGIKKSEVLARDRKRAGKKGAPKK
jgi:hypothetical protein